MLFHWLACFDSTSICINITRFVLTGILIKRNVDYSQQLSREIMEMGCNGNEDRIVIGRLAFNKRDTSESDEEIGKYQLEQYSWSVKLLINFTFIFYRNWNRPAKAKQLPLL